MKAVLVGAFSMILKSSRTFVSSPIHHTHGSSVYIVGTVIYLGLSGKNASRHENAFCRRDVDVVIVQIVLTRCFFVSAETRGDMTHDSLVIKLRLRLGWALDNP